MSGRTPYLRKPVLLAAWAAVVVSLAVCLPRPALRGQMETTESFEQDVVTIHADFSQEWHEGGEDIFLLRGRCRIIHGDTVLRARKMVVWRDARSAGQTSSKRLAVYLEDEARVEQPGRSLSEPSIFLTLALPSDITIGVRRRMVEQPAAEDALFLRARQRRRGSQRTGLQQTQLVMPGEDPLGPELRSLQIEQPQEDLRRVRFFPRSAVPFNVLSFESTDTTPPEQVWVLTGGINLLIDGVEEFGTIDLSADRMVVWTRPGTTEEFRAETLQTRDTPFTVYLEGNIVIRQGENVLRASHAVYDAREDRALLLDAEVRAFIPSLQGDVRVRAERVRQLSQRQFHAQNAWATTSQFGQPGYRVQASDVFLEYRIADPWLGTGTAGIDPLTGAPAPVEEVPWITSLNNTFLIGEFPIFYTPYFSAPAESPPTPVRSISARQDRIFGSQVHTVLDMFKLLGLNEPDGVRWDLLADFMSRRGPAIGTAGSYEGADLFGLPGTFSGRGLAYYINDTGQDNLGLDRRDLEPRTRHRGRVQLRHQHDLPDNIRIFGEMGLLSDRNFLEQYYLDEFYRGKDNETLLYARQHLDNWAWTGLVRPQLNDFENRTEWLPRGDLYLLSEPLLEGWLSWSSHTSAGYGRLRPARPPADPRDIFVPLPYVSESEGAVLMTRHELNAPLALGPVNLTPFVGGEAAYWSEDFVGDDFSRLFANAGVRGSVLFWRAFPFVRSRIFNLNGLAHKVRLETEYSWTDTTEDMARIPQYNEIDDDAQERFRQRFVLNTFGGVLPPQFDPRFYAVRRGAGLPVTAPHHELVEDQQVLRMALRQRLQTKVGPPERPRIRDWMTLDLEASYFPEPERDNFGEEFGLLGSRYAWHFSERTSLLADAHYDLFDGGQELWSLALLSQRSERGSIYLGMRQVKGSGLDSRILTSSYSYRMSPKWISTLGTAYDLGEGQNIGQSLTVSRVGADFIVHVGANFDQSTGNAGFALSLEPRFGPFSPSATQLSSLLMPR